LGVSSRAQRGIYYSPHPEAEPNLALLWVALLFVLLDFAVVVWAGRLFTRERLLRRR
jgi:hypothetical protein